MIKYLFILVFLTGCYEPYKDNRFNYSEGRILNLKERCAKLGTELNRKFELHYEGQVFQAYICNIQANSGRAPFVFTEEELLAIGKYNLIKKGH